MPARLPVEHSERFAELLTWLYERSPIQVSNEELVEGTGIPARSLYRHLKRMEELSIIVVDRTSEFGHGRLFNRYTVLVDPDTWRARAAATLADRRKREREEKRRDAAALRTEAQIAAANERAAAEIRAAAEMFAYPDPVILHAEESVRRAAFGDGGTDEELIDAWIGGAS